MASIERTAYARFKPSLTANELQTLGEAYSREPGVIAVAPTPLRTSSIGFRRSAEGATIARLETRREPIQVSPCQAGLTGLRFQRLLFASRFTPRQWSSRPFGSR
jgi:hypothetical protein